MPRLLTLGLAVACAAYAESGQSVGILLDFDFAPNRVALERMQREVADLLRPSGLLPAFLTAADIGVRAFQGVLVVKVRGKCSLERWRIDEPPSPRGAAPLASTVVQDGRPLPFSEVRCDAVRQSVGALDPRAGREEQQKAIGTTLGRVVAHELFHVLARSTEHASEGLARAVHNLRDLAGGKLAFQPEDLRAMAARPGPGN